MPRPLTAEQTQQVLTELHAGSKIAAVKLYRQHTGCSLLKAKDDVEALAAGRPVAPPDVHSDLDGAQMDEILDHIQSGRKLDAIKVYKASSGLSLMESKEFIERLMRELEVEHRDSLPRGTGCGSVTLLAIVVGSVFFVVAM